MPKQVEFTKTAYDMAKAAGCLSQLSLISKGEIGADSIMQPVPKLVGREDFPH